MTLDKKRFKQEIVDLIEKEFALPLEAADSQQIFYAVSRTALSMLWPKWNEYKKTLAGKESKQAFYLSAEFLMGRAMSNNLINLKLENDIREALEDLGISYNQMEDTEMDAGLGNGGLGRLAACFLDSLATHNLPGHGYGIRYKFGMFRQEIIDGQQVEKPDNWLKNKDPWAVKRSNESVLIKFGGDVEVKSDSEGRQHFKRINVEEVVAIPYDMPIIGYGNNTVNTLRLWEAESPEEFDLQLFNNEQYQQAVAKKNSAEDISRVLYPNDMGPSGKTLRLKQQYFFVSASLQDIIRKYKYQYGTDFSGLADKIAVQLNDTHPVVAIPELMRILMDWEKLEWNEAWQIVTRVFAYTNHTILSEALEKWPIDIFSSLLPRIYQLIEEINRRFLQQLRITYPGDWEKQQQMSIIGDGVIRMAWLAIVGSHSVNGVAALHTQILKERELKVWNDMFPHKFNNKTNGVTQRRWLLKSNPQLASFISARIGEGWITELSQLEKLSDFADDEASLKELIEIKRTNKVELSNYLGMNLNPDSIFDVQVKRLHEYKRQLLNVLHIMYLYNRLKADPELDIYPRTFLFGAKAASGYLRAKRIIHLITTIGEKINNDPQVNKKLQVHFLPNYRVSLAEKIFPASDVSEQISTASKEASGTGNMKFMMNGAVTIGTLDGANIEIVEEAGEENAFIFGLKTEEVYDLYNSSYNPYDLLSEDEELEEVMQQLINGFYGNAPETFREIYDSLVYGVDGNRPDVYFVLKDFRDYVRAQDELDKAYRDPMKWARMALINIAKSGKFSSDRTIKQYADEIWNIKPVI